MWTSWGGGQTIDQVGEVAKVSNLATYCLHRKILARSEYGSPRFSSNLALCTGLELELHDCKDVKCIHTRCMIEMGGGGWALQHFSHHQTHFMGQQAR